MSEEFEPHQEDDRVARGAIGVVALVSVLVMGISFGVVHAMLGPAVPVKAAPAPAAGLGLAKKSEQRVALDHLGWADRDAGLARIPIERAIDIVVERARNRDGGVP
jgi:hypothetical protein